MREIKFKAWHIASGAMLEWDRLKHLRYAIESETFLVLQYTGLKDKNGKEIYEGDIIKDDDGDIMTVDWSEKFASFCIDKKGWAFQHWFGEAINPQNIEVIGNIYENPELIK